jgi:hypothetical protein
MEQLGVALRGRLVVWFAYPENDLQDNLAPEMRNYRAPFVRFDPSAGGWRIADEHLQPRKWECSNLDARRLFPMFCVPGPLSDRAYSACDYLIGRAERACHKAGARLVMVTIPHPMQLTKRGICRGRGIPLVVGKDHLSRSDYKYREGIHWNRRGHRRMAMLLGRIYESFRSDRLDELVAHRVEKGASRVARPSVSRPAPTLGVER